MARRHDVSTALIYTWRRKLCEPASYPCLTEAVVIDEDARQPLKPRPAIVVQLQPSEHLRWSDAHAGYGSGEGIAVIPSGARVWLSMGHTDMRKGRQGLALLVQQHLKRDSHLCVGRDYVAEPP
ncbi:IS66 family insertion sequence element accessory protein TnpB [Mesorhizobium sp. M1396]|uniref:IS66 family insertion sequence element accessory protein TnpB n=1 Tax=Mesorhizobium sp. M1396 TaxID=2957095 RepID=UPI00333AAF12